MNLYLGLSCYDGMDAETLRGFGVDGVIVGDILCNRRMFRYGDDGLTELVCGLDRTPLEIVYQTPMYVTDRNFGKEIVRIEMLCKRHNVQKLLVQDVGLARWITENLPETELVWSRLGRTRNSLTNRFFAEFLQSKTINSLETDSFQRLAAASRLGIKPYAVCGSLKYNTISRECYSLYLSDRYDGVCRRECRNAGMVLSHNGFSITVDGFLLGAKTEYPDLKELVAAAEACDADIMIYADTAENADQLVSCIKKNLSERGESK